MVEPVFESTTSEFTVAARARADRLNRQPDPDPVVPMGAQRAEQMGVTLPSPAPAQPEQVQQQDAGLVVEDLVESGEAFPFDPDIIKHELSEDPILQAVNGIVYGVEAVDQAMQSRAEGNLQRDLGRGMYKPTTDVSRYMAYTGLNETAVGYYLLAKNNPRMLAVVGEVLGEANLDALNNAAESMARFDAGETTGDTRGFFASIGSTVDDVGGLVSKNEFADALRTGAAGALGSINRIGEPLNWAYNVGQLIEAIPGINRGAEFIGLTTLGVDFTPRSPEDISKLKEAIPDYFHRWAGNNDTGLDNIEVNKRKRLHLNPKELKAFNEAFGFEGNEANIQSIDTLEAEWREYIDTVTGGLTSVAVEYGILYASSPRFTKGATFMSRAINGLLKGAVADNVIYEEGDGNLARALVELGAPGSDLLEATLATDESDSWLMNRAKVTVEGMGLGIAAESLGYFLIGARAARMGDTKKAVESYKKAMDSQARSDQLETQKLIEDIARKKAEGRAIDQAQMEIAEGARRASGATETKEAFQFDYDRLPDWNDGDSVLLKTVDKFVRTSRVAGIDADMIETVFGRGFLDDLKANGDINATGQIYQIDADDLQTTVQLRIAAMFEKINNGGNGTTMNNLRGMAARLLEELDEDMLDPNMLDKFRTTDISDWSSNDAANIFAAGMLQRTYVEQMHQIASDLATRGAQMADDAFMQQGKRLDALQAQIAILQGGRAKAARNASHALLALKAEKSITGQLNATIRQATWDHQNNRITVKRKAEIIDAAMTHAANRRAKAKVANQVSTKPTTLEKLLHVSNANLLFNTGTQALMIFGNAFRATIRNPLIDFIEGLVIEPLTYLRGDKDAWARSGKAIQRGLGQYDMMVRSFPKAMQAFGKFWRTGKSQFTEHTMFDERGYFSGKTLEEVRRSNAEGALDQGMKAAEHVYRFMGAVDEAFKEMIVRTEMGLRAKTGDYTQKLQVIAAKRMPTDKEFAEYLTGAPNAAIRNKADRLVDRYAVDVATQTTFQSEAVEGSMNKALRDFLNNKSNTSQLIRLFAMRFVATPLNVMEERFASLLSGPLLLTNGRGFRVVAGKFAADLQAKIPGTDLPDMRIRSRTRASLMASNMMMTLGLLSAIGVLRGGQEDELVDVDPKSPTFGHFRGRGGDGKKRFYNIMDLELPFMNAFVMGRIGAEALRNIRDPKEAVELIDGLGLLAAIYVNETLEKSSLANLTDTVAAITDDKFRGMGNLVSGNVAAFVPFNWWTVRAMELGNRGDFEGKPLNFVQSLGKRIPILRPLIGSTSNSERNALGELVPSQNRGFFPFATRRFPTSIVEEELADIRLNTGVSFVNPRFERGDIPFHEITVGNRSLYDMMQERIAAGDIKVDGMTLREMATQMVSDPDGDYQRQYREWSAGLAIEGRNSEGDLKVKVGGRAMQDPRIQRWRDILATFREAALDQMIQTADDELYARLQTLKETSTEFSEDTLDRVYEELYR